MTSSLVSRSALAIFSVFALLVFTWGLVRLTGDPIRYLVPPDATLEQRAAARERLGLDEPLPVQFGIYLSGVVRGDLGITFRRSSLQTPVTQAIAERVPATLSMGFAALLVLIVVGIPLGIYSAYWHGGVFDKLARLYAAIGQAAPDFWFGLMLILVFAVAFKLLPSGGSGGIEHVVLPALTLSFGFMAGLIRLLRSSMLEVLTSDYVAFHRIKGTPERTILWKHALRNAGLTTLTYLGLIIPGLLTGSVLVETIFNWPGIGRLFIEAIEFRDFPLIQGLMLVFGVTYVVMNLVVDILYVSLNPRLR